MKILKVLSLACAMALFTNCSSSDSETPSDPADQDIVESFPEVSISSDDAADLAAGNKVTITTEAGDITVQHVESPTDGDDDEFQLELESGTITHFMNKHQIMAMKSSSSKTVTYYAYKTVTDGVTKYIAFSEEDNIKFIFTVDDDNVIETLTLELNGTIIITGAPGGSM